MRLCRRTGIANYLSDDDDVDDEDGGASRLSACEEAVPLPTSSRRLIANFTRSRDAVTAVSRSAAKMCSSGLCKIQSRLISLSINGRLRARGLQLRTHAAAASNFHATKCALNDIPMHSNRLHNFVLFLCRVHTRTPYYIGYTQFRLATYSIEYSKCTMPYFVHSRFRPSTHIFAGENFYS